MRKSPFLYGYRLTQRFSNAHEGYDMVALKETGKDWIGAPVLANEAGKVFRAYANHPVGGNFIILQSNDSKRLFYYGHLKDILVSNGQAVSEGQEIGHQGRTGQVTGEHLHFGAKIDKYDGNPWVDPFVLINAYTVPAEAPADGGEYLNYTVKPGDTLSKIALQIFGDASRWPEFEYQGNPNVIIVGQVIRLRVKNHTPSSNQELPYFEYKVQKGDTLWGIAQKYLGDGNKYPLLGWHGASNALPVGTILKIPKR